MDPATAAVETRVVNATTVDKSHWFLVMDAISLCCSPTPMVGGAIVWARKSVATAPPHPGCGAPTFPTNVAATISEPSATVSGSVANRRGTVPNTTCTLSRGLNSELCQGDVRTFFSPRSALTHVQIAQSPTLLSPSPRLS